MPQWENSTRRDRLPKDWPQIRLRRLRADKYACQWKLDDGGSICGAKANQVDHIVPGDDHRQTNLRSLCQMHHDRKSSSEGGAARAIARRRIANKFKRTEEHPGLL